MKNIFALITLALLLSACNQNQNQTHPSQAKYDSLVNVINERDESITNFVTSLNDIERNLDSITIKQRIISLNTIKSGEFTQTQKIRINDEIKSINTLMNKNRIKLEELNKKNNTSTSNNKILKTTIKTITNQLAQKQRELVDLNITLVNLNAQVEELKTSVDFLVRENGVQSDIIEFSISALHTAYYVIGKSKVLHAAKIIDKKGGLLGLGKTTEISSEINNDNFTKIDYIEKTSFKINAKGVKVITNHSPNSYFLETDINNKDMVNNLVITNPALFWSLSKYLVITTK